MIPCIMLIPEALPLIASDDYTVTVLGSVPIMDTSFVETNTSEVPAGESINELFGPIAEVRVGFMGLNATEIDDDSTMVAERIRERLDAAVCLGPEAEVAWHKAPWMRGYILLEDERILPVQILLSGIVIGDMLFAEK